MPLPGTIDYVLMEGSIALFTIFCTALAIRLLVLNPYFADRMYAVARENVRLDLLQAIQDGVLSAESPAGQWLFEQLEAQLRHPGQTIRGASLAVADNDEEGVRLAQGLRERLCAANDEYRWTRRPRLFAHHVRCHALEVPVAAPVCVPGDTQIDLPDEDRGIDQPDEDIAPSSWAAQQLGGYPSIYGARHASAHIT